MFHSQQDVKVYENLDDYVGDVSRKFSLKVKLGNVKNLFLFFAAFLMLILLLFVIDVFLFKLLRMIKRKLVRRSIFFFRRIISEGCFSKGSRR